MMSVGTLIPNVSVDADAGTVPRFRFRAMSRSTLLAKNIAIT